MWQYRVRRIKNHIAIVSTRVRVWKLYSDKDLPSNLLDRIRNASPNPRVKGAVGIVVGCSPLLEGSIYNQDVCDVRHEDGSLALYLLSELSYA
jgi:hypothetical protein